MVFGIEVLCCLTTFLCPKCDLVLSISVYFISVLTNKGRDILVVVLYFQVQILIRLCYFCSEKIQTEEKAQTPFSLPHPSSSSVS